MKPAYVIIPRLNYLTGISTALWRQAGPLPGWVSISDITTGDWMHDAAQAIARSQQIDPGMAVLYAYLPSPNPFFGIITDAEADVLAGASVLARSDNLITIGVDACGIHLLLRLAPSGIIEVLAFGRSPHGSPVILIPMSDNSTASFLAYTRIDDTIIGSPDTKTRIMDCGRISPWGEISYLISKGEVAAARLMLHGWFATEVNPRFPSPYNLDLDSEMTEGRDMAIEERQAALIMQILVAEGLDNATGWIELPRAALGLARVVIDLDEDGRMDTERLARVQLLCSLAAMEIPGYGCKTIDRVQRMFAGYQPNDTQVAIRRQINLNQAPTGHERLAALHEVRLFWQCQREDKAFKDNVALFTAGLGATALVTDLDRSYPPRK